MNHLNPRQKESVLHIDGPLLVLAGAGSGKTSVITTKIAYLIEQCGVPARNITALTFTNKAAKEMKERVAKLVQGKAASGLTVSTFHNLGLNIIRKEHKHLGIRPGFSIFDDGDTKSLLKDIMHREHDADGDMVDMIKQQIGTLKNDLIEPEQAVQMAQTPQEMLVAQTYLSYDRSLKAYNAVDFDDLIRIPTLLFMNNQSVREKWQKNTRYLLVDEYQDTNTSQYELVKILVGHHCKFTVVGDDDQSIYAWRGAKPENLSLLKTDFPNLKIVMLEQNYRSTGLILNAANQVIENNPHEFVKKLWSDKGYGDPIRIVKCKSEDNEAERIATEIIEHRLRHQSKYRDYAILFRGNHQSRLMEMKLQQYQVPYKLSGSQSFFAKSEVKDIMSYLKLIVNPTDDAAFLRVINIPRRQIGPSTLEKLTEYAGRRQLSLMSASTELGLEQILPPLALDKLQRFGNWIQNTTKRCFTDDPVQSIKEMVHDLDYEAWLHQTSNTPNMAEARMKNVWFLIDNIERMLTKAEENGDEMSIEDAVAKLILRDMLEQQEQEDELDQVQLMTLHASKGLEFPYVWIMGLEEEILPHRNSIEADTVEEERRLMYVGITRAKQNLTLTLTGKRKSYGESFEPTPSRFLEELPKDDIQREGFGEVNPEQKQARGVSALAGLKNLMSS
ncbi:DNA helicase Rep [Bermanella sp. WJH001]|uniref:DNA helicase Rep n=1 Tax=Bermanella sp. WJH001 TaxID=3048005 RepID=UPI0024BF09B7|nr:DNA helicase Rep [Bermanella sp. WJH001]MDJ1538925.1 DNA helicase Rep [Bermanella sp. WJH001]